MRTSCNVSPMLEIVGNTVLKLEYSCEFVTLVNNNNKKRRHIKLSELNYITLIREMK